MLTLGTQKLKIKEQFVCVKVIWLCKEIWTNMVG